MVQSASTARLNQRREIGSPCLMPCLLWMKGPVVRLIQWRFATQDQLHDSVDKPCMETLAEENLLEDQLTRLYAFSKSSFRTMTFFFLHLISWTTLWKQRIPSRMCLPLRKVIWLKSAILAATGPNLLE